MNYTKTDRVLYNLLNFILVLFLFILLGRGLVNTREKCALVQENLGSSILFLL